MRARAAVAFLIGAVSLGGCAGRHRTSAPEPRGSAGPAGGGHEFPRHYLASTEEEVVGPSVPLLRSKQGQAPLVRVSEAPDDFESNDPSFEFAVFEDGTLAYEGDRCVKVGGLVLARLDRTRMQALQALIVNHCAALPRRSAEVWCSHGDTIAIECLSQGTYVVHRDNCNTDERGRALRGVARKMRDLVGVAEWIGLPGQRQGCRGIDVGMAMGEIQRTIQPEKKTIWRYLPVEDRPTGR